LKFEADIDNLAIATFLYALLNTGCTNAAGQATLEERRCGAASYFININLF